MGDFFFNNSLGGNSLSYDGTDFYITYESEGADAVTKKLGSGKAKYLGTARSYDMSSYPNYQNFTAGNFICVCSSKNVTVGNYNISGEIGCMATFNAVTKSYNSSTGVLTIGGGDLYLQLHQNGLLYSKNQPSCTVSTYFIEGGIE